MMALKLGLLFISTPLYEALTWLVCTVSCSCPVGLATVIPLVIQAYYVNKFIEYHANEIAFWNCTQF